MIPRGSAGLKKVKHPPPAGILGWKKTNISSIIGICALLLFRGPASQYEDQVELFYD